MYTPSHSPGLVVEHLFDEKLVLVSSRPEDEEPGEDYVYIEWGPGFYAQHAQGYPDLETPPQIANIGWLGIQLIINNGGSCYLPERMALNYIRKENLYLVSNAPEYIHPTYMVYPRQSDNPVLEESLSGLRELAGKQPG
jgi:DNA-binding transcriptional LysR family regulator